MATFPLQPGMADVIDGGVGSQMMSAPPQNPQEVEGRKAAWQQVLDDPNVKSSILRMGLNLMQGQEQGENVVQTLGRTGLDAMDFYGFKTELDRKRDIDERALKLDERRGEAAIANDEAHTASTVQQTSQEGVKFAEWSAQADLRKQKAEQEVKTLVAQGKTAEANARKSKFEADELQQFQAFKEANPQLKNLSYQATLEAPIAAVNADKARVTASNASAAASMEDVNASREGRAAMPAWIRVLPDEEAQSYAMANKGQKTQSQIEEDISQGLHHGFMRKFDTSTADNSGFDGMATALVNEYLALPEATKAKFSGFDAWVTTTKQATIGKNLGRVLQLGNAKLQAGQGAPAASGPTPVPPPNERVVGKAYVNAQGQSAIWTGKGWQVE